VKSSLAKIKTVQLLGSLKVKFVCYMSDQINAKFGLTKHKTWWI